MLPHRARALATALHDIWSTGATERLSELLTTDFVCHLPRGWEQPDIIGREAMARAILEHRLAFPDWTETISDLIVDGDRVASRFTATATHLGPFQSLPPTGRSVSVDEIAIFRTAKGRFAEQWFLSDDLALQNQLAGSA